MGAFTNLTLLTSSTLSSLSLPNTSIGVVTPISNCTASSTATGDRSSSIVICTVASADTRPLSFSTVYAKLSISPTELSCTYVITPVAEFTDTDPLAGARTNTTLLVLIAPSSGTSLANTSISIVPPVTVALVSFCTNGAPIPCTLYLFFRYACTSSCSSSFNARSKTSNAATCISTCEFRSRFDPNTIGPTPVSLACKYVSINTPFTACSTSPLLSTTLCTNQPAPLPSNVLTKSCGPPYPLIRNIPLPSTSNPNALLNAG